MFGTNLFGIGMPELIFIAIIALIVLGPQRLPGVLREVAKFIGQLRGMVSELTSQFSEEIAMLEELDPRKLIDEVTQPINELTKPLSDTKSDVKPDTKSDTESKTSKAATDTASSITTSKKVDESGTYNGKAATSTKKDTPITPAEEDGTATSDDTVEEDVSSSDDAAKGTQAQVQTDPSNVASTEPYKNRTPNLNLIKRPSKDEATDLASDIEADLEPEENQIAPPEMQEKLAQETVSKAASASKKIADGSTAAKLVAGKAVTESTVTESTATENMASSNGNSSEDQNQKESAVSDSKSSDSNSDKAVES